MTPKIFPRHALGAALLVALLSVASFVPAAHAAWNTNLIVNAGAEDAVGGDGTFASNLPGWNVTGELTAIDYSLGCPGGYPCLTDPGPSDPGLNHFGSGYAASSRGTQTIDLSFAQGGINGAGAYYSLSGWLGGYASQTDNAILSVSFLNASNQVIGGSGVGPVSAAERGNATAMLYREATGWMPAGTTSAQVELLMTRTGGTSNDGYADNLALSLAPANVVMTAPGQAAVGASFDVTVAVMSPFASGYSGDELLAFGFDLGFDPALVSLTGVSVAGPWDDDSGYFSDVAVAGSVFESIADADQGTVDLATLTFKVLAEGDVLIDVHSDAAGNLNEGLTYGLGDNVDLYGRASVVLSPVPEPGEWLMMSAGLLLLALRRRRN